MLAWDQLVFALPLLVGVVLAAGMATGAHGHDAHHDAHHDHDHPDMPTRRRLPLSLLLTLGPLLFGAIGWTLQAVTGSVLVALPAALLGAVAGTRLLGRAIGRWLPLHESYAQSREDLVGCTGHLILPAGPTQGLAQVHDRHGNLQQVQVCTTSGDLPKDAQVLVIRYDEATARFVVSTDPVLSLQP